MTPVICVLLDEEKKLKSRLQAVQEAIEKLSLLYGIDVPSRIIEGVRSPEMQ